MFCSKCGTENKEDSKFCEKCGNKLEKPAKVKKDEVKELETKKEDKYIYCEKCGTKNNSNSKFCEKCGDSLKNSSKKTNGVIENIKSKIQKLPKKAKIGLGLGLLIIIVAIVSLAILLSNPVKKVENYLTSYYSNYETGNEELVKIGEILKSNKDDEAKLESISAQISKTINNWVKNFNKSYQNETELEEEFEKLSSILKEIYNYFDGSEYVLTSEDYYKYYEEIRDLYDSKLNYFKAQEASSDIDKYTYYSKVIETDSYYKEANEFISNYLSEELDELKTNAENIVDLDENATNEEYLKAYIEQLEYIKENTNQNGIDLSVGKTYQELYNNAVSKIVEYTKAYAEELEMNLETNNVMDMIENSMSVLEYNSDAYQELEELQATYEEKLPDKLVSKYLVSSTSGSYDSTYRIVINEEEYDSYVRFSFIGETVSRVYRLNNEYKTFKATIVRGPDWDADFSGEIVIYGDGEELYRSGTITKTSELNAEINIDITDVDDLKIEFITESEPDGWSSFYIYLVEPYLYK